MLLCTGCEKNLHKPWNVSLSNKVPNPFGNRALDYAKKNFTKSKTCSIVVERDSSMTIEFGVYQTKQDSAAYEADSNLKELGASIFDAAYYDMEQDTVFMEHHFLSFQIEWKDGETIYKYPLTMFW